MVFKLNCSPHLRMHEITKKLFNRNFLSDIRFSVDGKIIYAHSLELMKRSVVFEKEFEDTCGEKRVIPISDYKYENVLEFVRFIYTDECEINDSNGMELLKLAIKYKILMLESQIINKLSSTEWELSLFEYCVLENYEAVRFQCEHCFKLFYAHRLQNEKFLLLHPDAVKVAIQFDTVGNGVTEIQRFSALAKWITKYCEQQQMTLAEGRQKFDDQIKEIRFPTMSSDEMRDCVKNYPGLLSDSDCMSIGRQVVFGSVSKYDPWISTNRNDYEFNYEWRQINQDTAFETKILVSKDTILHGLWIGIEVNRTDVHIEITTKDINENEIDKTGFTQIAPGSWPGILICLGDSLRLVPNFEYTVAVKFLNITNAHLNVLCRGENADLIYNDPDNCIHIVMASENMLEMIFKPTAD